MTDGNKAMTSRRQLAWVFDLNKCIGCQTCSVACKVLWTQDDGTDHRWWMTVNTQPGRGTPRDWETMGGGYKKGKAQVGKLPTPEEFGGGWDYNYDEVLRGGKGRSVFLEKIAGSKTWGPNWDEDEGGGTFPNAYFFYLPRLCNHCSDPVCVEACPNSALFKREEDGLVLRDEDRCRGAQDCARACPYKKIYRPNVYYGPPLAPAPLNEDGSANESGSRIPPEYLESLFGPEVHGAVETLKAELDRRRRGEPSELMDILIMYEWKEALGPFARDPVDIVWT
jgi:Fe-S-cluster-containing dehydrogenase component